MMDQAAPEMEWKIWVSAGQSGDEMIFEGSDGAFSNDSAMVARWCQLVSDCAFMQEVF